MEKDNKKDIQYKPALFQHEPDFFVLYKKIQNISSAIFLVTDSISDTPANSIKVSIRDRTLECLFELSESIAGNAPLFEALRRLGASLLTINALLDILFWTKLVSKNNFDILQTEIQKIYSLTNDLLSRYASRFALENRFFEQNYGEGLTDSASKGRDAASQIPSLETYKGQKDKRTSPLENSHTKAQGIKPVQDSEDKSKRRKAILDLLKQKDNLSIKDISSVVKGYSEKTIQRELISLMSEGLIARQGKRRWSTYSLIK